MSLKLFADSGKPAMEFTSQQLTDLEFKNELHNFYKDAVWADDAQHGECRDAQKGAC